MSTVSSVPTVSAVSSVPTVSAVSSVPTVSAVSSVPAVSVVSSVPTDTLQIQKAVTRIGLQSNHELWVMGEGIQIDAHGEMVPVEYQSHIWLDWSVQQGLGTISLKEVLPTVMVPLTSRIIHTAFRLLMKHNFIPSILMMAGRIMFFSTFCTCDFVSGRIHSIPALLLYFWLPNCCCQRTFSDREVDSS